jgi:hypothetical protein
MKGEGPDVEMGGTGHQTGFNSISIYTDGHEAHSDDDTVLVSDSDDDVEPTPVAAPAVEDDEYADLPELVSSSEDDCCDSENDGANFSHPNDLGHFNPNRKPGEKKTLTNGPFFLSVLDTGFDKHGNPIAKVQGRYNDEKAIVYQALMPDGPMAWYTIVTGITRQILFANHGRVYFHKMPFCYICQKIFKHCGAPSRINRAFCACGPDQFWHFCKKGHGYRPRCPDCKEKPKFVMHYDAKYSSLFL